MPLWGDGVSFGLSIMPGGTKLTHRPRRRPARQPGSPPGDAGAVLNQAMHHHQAGRLERARGLYERLIKEDPDNADALHLLGLVAHRQGDHAGALEHIGGAIRLKGDAATYHNNLGSVLLGLGRHAEAETSYRRALKIRPGYAEAHCNLGAALHKEGRLEEAEAACRRALAISSDYAEAHNNLGNVLRERGRANEAEAAFQRALEINPAYADANNNLGNLLQERGEAEAAEARYRRALAVNPNFAAAHCNLGSALEAQGRLEEAAAGHRAAIRLNPDYARAHTELAGVLQEQGDTAEAEGSYRRALDGEPDFAAAHAGLAALFERANRLKDAAAAAEEALRLEADNILAHLVAAKCARRSGQPEEGLRRLQSLDPAHLDAANRAAVCFELGTLLDRSGDFDRAYEAYTEGNRCNAGHWRARQADAAAHPRKVTRLGAAFSPEWVASWTPAVPEDAPPPAFLVGFPRSGTTLLDRILDAHPRLVTLEEIPAVDAVAAKLAAMPGGYPEALAGLSAGDIESLRRVYYDEVARHMERPRRGVLLVDKLPLNMTDAGLIHRLFPTAKFVFSLRHPCDVVLSGFMQPFEPNQAMVHFATLEDTARLYVQVMGLWRQSVEVLALAVHAVRYEDLVADLAGEARAVLDFLAVPWDDAVLQYREGARRRGSSTPSYHQVVQPIYTRSVGRWTNYRDRLEPVLPLLRPWIEAFGYDAPVAAGDTA